MSPRVPFQSLLSYPLRSGFTVAAADRGVGIRMVNMGELFAHSRIPDVDMARVQLPSKDAERTLLAEGDLLFARRSLTLEGAGKCSIVGRIGEATTWESSIIRARVDSELGRPDYYFYYFRSPGGRRQIEEIVEQVAAAGIRLSELATLEVPCPPLAEQQAIAEVLGALDDKIAANDKLSTLLLEHLTAGVAVAVADDPETVTLGDIAVFHNRLRVPLSSREREVRRGPVPYYGAAGQLDTVDTHLFDMPLALVGEDGSVVNDGGGPVLQYIWGPAWVNNHAHVLTGTAVSTELLFVLLQSCKVQDLVTGAVQPKLSMGSLKRLSLRVPSPERRPEVEAASSSQMALRRSLAEENATLAATRDALLPQLMSGKLRVKEAEKKVEALV